MCFYYCVEKKIIVNTIFMKVYIENTGENDTFFFDKDKDFVNLQEFL